MSSPEPEPAPGPRPGLTYPSVPPPHSGEESPHPPGKSSSSYHWSVAVIVVVLIIAVTAIIFAIIDYLKWSRSSIPISTPITSHDNTDNASDRVSSNLRRRHPSTVPDDYQVEFPTIKGFLSQMAREKPTTYSAKQIAEFTNNYSYSNILGSGGFGVVYKGLL
ncbi:hypothetical protein M0R45_036504 [Rubus argutus]|uniref:Uncharacterized protein n=1 Tax=Rubus argutus TaxID=59490 RepID=A0AAW1W0M4_RUBAR